MTSKIEHISEMSEMEYTESDHLATMPHQAEQKQFNLDLVIEQIGPFGKFQFKIFSLICISSAFSTAFIYLYIFTAGEMDYRCRIPGCDTHNSGFEASFLNFTIPVDEDGLSKCEKFHAISNTTLDECEPHFFDPKIPEQCSEFIYQGDETTILNEWDLGCTQDWKLSLVGTINNIGQLVCYLLTGYISDRFGRQNAFMWSAIFAASIGVIQSFSTNYTMFIILEFLEPALGAGMFNTGFILAMEHIGTKKRVFWAFLPTIFASVGLASIGVIYMLTKEWRLLLRIFYIPTFLFITYRWLIPESPRWLVRKDRIEEAAKIIESSAKLNKIELTSDAREMLNQMHKSENSRNRKKKSWKEPTNGGQSMEYHLRMFLKSRTMIIRFIICAFCWASMIFVYNGLSMTSVFIAGDKYVNYILNCLIEIPSGILGCLLIERIGRRKVLCSSFLISGATCLAYIFFKEYTLVAQIIFLTGKFSITMSYHVFVIYTAEIFPTELRQSLFSGCCISGSIGAILAPFTLYLGKYMESMEMILFAAVTIPAGIFILFAPETLNKPLPNTIEEAENLK